MLPAFKATGPIVLVRELAAAARWIGRCRICRAGGRKGTHKLEGASGLTLQGIAIVHADGTGIATSRVYNEDASVIAKCPGCDTWIKLHKVTEGTKKSRHKCGAICRNATGPACDCMCRGANHGANC